MLEGGCKKVLVQVSVTEKDLYMYKEDLELSIRRLVESSRHFITVYVVYQTKLKSVDLSDLFCSSKALVEISDVFLFHLRETRNHQQNAVSFICQDGWCRRVPSRW